MFILFWQYFIKLFNVIIDPVAILAILAICGSCLKVITMSLWVTNETQNHRFNFSIKFFDYLWRFPTFLVNSYAKSDSGIMLSNTKKKLFNFFTKILLSLWSLVYEEFSNSFVTLTSNIRIIWACSHVHMYRRVRLHPHFPEAIYASTTQLTSNSSKFLCNQDVPEEDVLSLNRHGTVRVCKTSIFGFPFFFFCLNNGFEKFSS